KKGAYENCGAMTHKSKDRMVQNWSDAKRNRWNDYDPSDHYEKIEKNIVNELHKQCTTELVKKLVN
ncbi:15781_t:CDS:2, partial [Entrophospora sp. SA101]